MHPTPPKAKIQPYTHSQHNKQRIDNYFWLRERDSPDVLAYLQAENDYTKAVFEPYVALQNTIFEEIKGRIPPNEENPPFFKEGYWYYSKYVEGGEYPIYCRKKQNLEMPEEVTLDVNALSKIYTKYCAVIGASDSPDKSLLKFALDSVGRNNFTIRIKDLKTGDLLPDALEMASPGSVWGNDSKSIFYCKRHPETLREYQVWKHILGTPQTEDALIYEEKDETFSLHLHKTSSKKFLVIYCVSTTSSENLFYALDEPNAQVQSLLPRQANHEYVADHTEEGLFYIHTNKKVENFHLMICPDQAMGNFDAWEDFYYPPTSTYLESFDVFSDFIVLQTRANASTQIEIIDKKGSYNHAITFNDSVYMVQNAGHAMYHTDNIRIIYTSLTTQITYYDYYPAAKELKMIKQTEIPGGHNPSNYKSERIWVSANDGAAIPVSLVYHKDTPVNNGTAPLLQYGYGSYGISMDAYFSPSRLSLLDRGFVFAIAHIRGGQELGRAWYEAGRQKHKRNTFTDFIACSKHLITHGYAHPEKLFAMGGSAGGLLMGAIANMAPNLYKGIIAQVPFLDVVTTMFDDTLPLTTGEYDEWGNPNIPDDFDYILSYSPYDNVEAKNYPAIFVLTGYHDSQVQYWEPAKWVAKLRAAKTDQNLILLYTDMEAGHGGASGRYKPLAEIAKIYTFLLMQLNYK
ncbi:MAG: S9 family peptidase [Sphingobacteriales bacterium]|jgi:oligopeptidase B|nr:S9 family peptidase [Sphingobacteriales bacterium]MBK8680179.1 S9 family peptidase [Sphingobacteriales bacterium]MBL0248134.1 S9 family peptidase [Sphingobacteriales bacterium]MBP9140873.1 S9 family peptidase [Chitinophagales bacterium]